MLSCQPADGSSHASAFFHLLALPISLTMDRAAEMTDAATFKMFSTNFNLPMGSSFPPAYLYGAIERIYQYGSYIYDRQDQSITGLFLPIQVVVILTFSLLLDVYITYSSKGTEIIKQ